MEHITNEFKAILKEVIQTASQEELTSHLGYDKHQTSDSSNFRNGYNDKTISSKYGQFDVSIPRDREATFEPQPVKKREVLLYEGIILLKVSDIPSIVPFYFLSLFPFVLSL